jgi:thymidine phosphorylase
MRIADVIIKKRDGQDLTDEEIKFFIKELVDGRLEGSQLGISIKYHIGAFSITHLTFKDLKTQYRNLL